MTDRQKKNWGNTELKYLLSKIIYPLKYHIVKFIRLPVTVPAALAIFPEEISVTARPFAEYKCKVSCSKWDVMQRSIFIYYVFYFVNFILNWFLFEGHSSIFLHAQRRAFRCIWGTRIASSWYNEFREKAES